MKPSAAQPQPRATDFSHGSTLIFTDFGDRLIRVIRAIRGPCKPSKTSRRAKKWNVCNTVRHSPNQEDRLLTQRRKGAEKNSQFVSICFALLIRTGLITGCSEMVLFRRTDREIATARRRERTAILVLRFVAWPIRTSSTWMQTTPCQGVPPRRLPKNGFVLSDRSRNCDRAKARKDGNFSSTLCGMAYQDEQHVDADHAHSGRATPPGSILVFIWNRPFRRRRWSAGWGCP